MTESSGQHLTEIANRLGSDKGTSTYCGHGYTRVYESMLAAARTSSLRLAEIGLMHVYTQDELATGRHESGCPSLDMWGEFLPNARIAGFDIVDFSRFSSERITVVQGDQGRREDLERFASSCGPFDVIIDDGSHASHHQQITLGVLFPHLAPGGIYVIEDLHFQPADMELQGITPTREFLRGIRHGYNRAHVAMTQQELGGLVSNLGDVRFFDSVSPKWPQTRLEDALAILTKRGAHPVLTNGW